MNFQNSILRVNNILEDNLLDRFMDTLQKTIQHEICLFKPKRFENAFSLTRKIESKNLATRMVAIDYNGKSFQSYPQLAYKVEASMSGGNKRKGIMF